jgi:hypothetical protein
VVIVNDEKPNVTKLKLTTMRTMMLETKLRNDMLATKQAIEHEELFKKGMNDGDGDGQSRATTETRNAHNDDNIG